MTVGLTDVINAAMQNGQSEMYVSFPARIESYDYTTQKASIKPLLNRTLTDGVVESLPVLANIPVWMPKSGDAAIIMPVKAGDICVAVCFDRSIDEWLDSGGEATPQDTRKHSMFDAVAFVGLSAFSDQSPAENDEDMLIVSEGNKIRIKPDGIIEIESEEKITITVPNAEINGDVQINGNLTVSNKASVGSLASRSTGVFEGSINVTGDVTAGGIGYLQHIHIDSQGGNTSAPQNG